MTAGLLLQQAMARHRAGDIAGAEALYCAVLGQDPANFAANHLLGVVHLQSGRAAEGVELIRKALRLRPGAVEAQQNLANGLMVMGRHAEALAAFDRVLALKPDHAEAHFNRGAMLEALGRPSEAVDAFGEAARLQPPFVEAHEARGRLLIGLARHAEALESFEAVARLRPGSAEAQHNRGFGLRRTGRPQAAIEAVRMAIGLDPRAAGMHVTLATALEDLGEFEAALAELDLAVALDPNEPIAQRNRALALLRLGRFAEGWPLYEWRKKAQPALARDDLPFPVWTGAEDLAGKTLFIHHEQGLGDTLMFCRYATLMAARAGQVVLSVQAPLIRLLKQLEPAVRVIGPDEDPGAVDFRVALMSLPHLLGTTPETIPASPALAADPELAKQWAERLGPKTRPRIGLVWSGNPQFYNDHTRSLPLASLAPALDGRFDWISLQPDVRMQDQATLAATPALRSPGRLADFAETAAVVAGLDLVVSVDTAVAHLAGAMGRPVWILLPLGADFRWLTAGEASAWYPSARLFRQTAFGDVAGVIARLSAALAERFPGG